MRQTQDEITQKLAARWWEVARRDESRIARRLDRKQEVEGGYRLDEGAVLDEFCPCLQRIGVMALLAEVHGAAIQREMVPCVPYVLRYGLKTLCGIERMHALPPWLCSDEALRPLIGCKAQPGREGVWQRGAAKRQGVQTPGPISPATLANNIVTLHLRALAVAFNEALRALAKAGGFGKTVTGMVDATDRETTVRSAGCGQATRLRRVTDQHGPVQEIEVTVFGWTVLLLIDARTKIPLALKVVQSPVHEPRFLRALVTQARTNLAGAARRSNGVVDRGVWAGTARWWLDQQGLTCVVPAQAKMTVPAEARAQATAGAEMTGGRRAHTARLEAAVVGITGLTTDEPYGTPEHGRHHHRRDCPPPPIHAVVVRQWPGKDDGPGGTPVLLTHASVATPVPVCDADDDRRLIANGCMKEAKPPWERGHPPQKTARAVRVHVVFTVLMVALATASRRQCERQAMGEEPSGWQPWRPQLQEQTQDMVIIFAEDYYGIFHIAEYSMLLGVKLKDVPPGIGTRQEILAKYGLAAHD